MWCEDRTVHEQCAAKIATVASEIDPLRQYRLALSEIAAGLAALPREAKREEWASVMAMYALHPETIAANALNPRTTEVKEVTEK